MSENHSAIPDVLRKPILWAVGAFVLATVAVTASRTSSATPAAGNLDVIDAPAAAAADNVGPAAHPTQQASAESLSREFRAAALRVLPAIVEIRDTSSESAIGSGILIDASGIVLTNHHVVQEVQRPVVQLADGRRFVARDVKSDPRSDLAIVQFDSPVPLPVAHLGDSNRLQIGDWILTLGSPLDLRQTVSAGIISATGRKLEMAGDVRLIQTDAAINPGSSGGALVDLRGEVVGVTTAIASQDGGYQGIGLAIPSNLAVWVVDQLRTHGQVRRSTIGITTVSAPPSYNAQTGLSPAQVKVTDVRPGSPAEKAGLRVDDVILAFDGTKISDPGMLEELVQQQELGSKHRLEFMRRGKTAIVEVVTEQAATPVEVANDDRMYDTDPTEVVYSRDLQIEVAPAAEPSVLGGGHPTGDGVRVLRAEPSGPAFRAGVREGMLIHQVNQQTVEDLDAFVEIMERASLADGIELVLEGPGGRKQVLVKEP